MEFGLQTYTEDGKLQLSLGGIALRIHSTYSVYIPPLSSWTLYVGGVYRYTFVVNIPDITVPSEWAHIEGSVPEYVASVDSYVMPYHSYVTIEVGKVTIMLMSSSVVNYYHRFFMVKK